MDFDDIVKIVDQVKVLEARLAAVEAERDAARAGEARAVEFASTVKSTIEQSLEYCKQDSEVSIELLKDLMNQADGIGYAHELGNALDWLAKQRREAAAEALDRLSGEWWAFNDEYIASELSARAASLRAGEVGNE